MKYTTHYGEQLLRLYSVLLYQPYYLIIPIETTGTEEMAAQSLDVVIVNRVIV